MVMHPHDTGSGYGRPRLEKPGVIRAFRILNLFVMLAVR